MTQCVACGDHPLNYIHCDRWDCPLLVVRETIEQQVTQIGLPYEGWGSEIDAVVVPLGSDDEIVGEEERDPSPPDEDDDEIAADWDENGYWPSENDEPEEDEDE